MKKNIVMLVLFLEFCLVSNSQILIEPSNQETNARLFNEVELGILDPLSSQDVSGTMSSFIIAGSDKEAKILSLRTKQWDSSNSKYITESLNEYLLKYDVSIPQNKSDLIVDHIKHFSAFKTAVYSSFPPSLESGKMIGAEIARGIRFVCQKDYYYPSPDELGHAYQQANRMFNDFERYMNEILVSEEDKTIAQTELYKKLDDWKWRFESPFFVHGKRVFSVEELDLILLQSIENFQKKFDTKSLELPAQFQDAPPTIQNKMKTIRIKQIVSYLTIPFLSAYAEGKNRAPSPEEIQEMKELADKIRSLFAISYG